MRFHVDIACNNCKLALRELWRLVDDNDAPPNGQRVYHGWWKAPFGLEKDFDMTLNRCYPAQILLMISITFTGCASVQLQRLTVRQANSVSDIYEQQVLDNLARFVVNPYATPSFSVANQSSNTVDERRSMGLSEGFLVGKFLDHISLSNERSLGRNFLFNPVTDPNRLALMQCAYQRAVGLEVDECNRCCQLIEAWTGKPGECWGPCGITCGWVCSSDDPRDVPACCEKHGRACGTYVWVDPCNRKEFSKLVMAIVDFASGDKAPPTDLKEVVFYLNDRGGFTTFGTQAQEVRALVPQDMDQQSIEKQLKLQATVVTLEKRLSELQKAQDLIGQLKTKQSNNADVDPIEFDRLQNLVPFEKLNAMKAKSKADSANAVVQAESDIKAERLAVESSLQQARDEFTSIQSSAMPTRPAISFGPPTQFNGQYGGGLLQLRQQLNTVQRPGLR